MIPITILSICGVAMFKDLLPEPTPEQLKQQLTRPQYGRSGVANDDLDGGMENPVVEISRDIFKLDADIRRLTIRVDKRLITKSVQESLSKFKRYFELYFESFKTEDNGEAIISNGANTATYGESVGHILNRFSSLGFENRRLAQQIIQRSRSINSVLATKKSLFINGLENYDQSELPQVEAKRSVATGSTGAAASSAALKPRGPFSAEQENVRLKRAKKSAENASSRTTVQPEEAEVPSRKQRLAEDDTARSTQQNDAQVEELMKKNRQMVKHLMINAKKAEKAHEAKYQKIQQLHEEALNEVTQSKSKIEQLRAQANEHSISKDFLEYADEERKSADIYLYATLAYSGVFLLLVMYLFIETTTLGFEWVRTVVRSGLALAMLAPCGFVARESGRHRTEQHNYTRAALKHKAAYQDRSEV